MVHSPLLLMYAGVASTVPKMPDVSPAAKSSRLTSQAEAMLLSFFALQDTLSKEDAVVLAQQVCQLTADCSSCKGAV